MFAAHRELLIMEAMGMLANYDAPNSCTKLLQLVRSAQCGAVAVPFVLHGVCGLGRW